MTAALLRTLPLSAFGIGLFLLWRAAQPSERWLKWIIAAGFLVRAILGTALFWISWARLPILTSFQLGDGYWLFAQDATFYFPRAVALAERGLRAVILYGRANASVSYVQLLACMIALVGRATSAGILLNLFCYLGTIALLVRWGRAEPRTRTATAFAIAAISFSPSLVLWSLQPLKDSFFQLLFVAFVSACAMWQHAWLAQRAWWQRAACGALMAAVLFLLAGLRWYFAAALLAAAALFLLFVAAMAAERKAIAFGAAAMLIFVMAESFAASAGPSIPPVLASASLRRLPQSMLAAIEQVRSGFDTTAAHTTIVAGRRPAATADAVPAPPASPLAPSLSAADAATIRASLDAEAAAWTRCDVARAMDLYWRSPELEIVDGTVVIRGWSQVAEERGRACRPLGSVRLTGLRFVGAGDMATLSGRWDMTSASGYQQKRVFTMLMRRFPDGQWKIVREVFPSAAAPVAPPSHFRRLLAGAEALLIPATLGKHLGLFDVGAGRGLLWFADIDTVIFDLALILALWALFAVPAAAAWRNPLMWLILLTLLLIVPPLVYSISNFGTLFRLREMIYLALLLIPIAAVETGVSTLPSSRLPRPIPRIGG